MKKRKSILGVETQERAVASSKKALARLKRQREAIVPMTETMNTRISMGRLMRVRRTRPA